MRSAKSLQLGDLSRSLVVLRKMPPPSVCGAVLLTTVRKLLAQSGMNHKGELESATKFWSYAIKHACRLHNALPSSRLQDEISPYQALTNRQPDASRYKVWGCIAWYLLELHQIGRSKNITSVGSFNPSWA